ncbi:MAG: hypothetical protein FK733_03915 [Asgard group archaeon]|nr:hypothetical protein [Asgard group archaeon]
MFSSSVEIFRNLFQKINQLNSSNTDELIIQLQSLLDILIDNLQHELPDFKPLRNRTIVIKDLKKEFGYDFGVQRTRSECRIASWLFDLSKYEKDALQKFLLVKEALLHFISISKIHPIFTESLINVIVLIFIKEMGYFSTVSDRAVRFINLRKRLNDTKQNFWFINSFILFFTLDISPIDIIKKYHSLILQSEEESWSEEKFQQTFNDWITGLYSPEDFFSPFYFQNRFIQIVKLLLNFGQEKSTTSFIASKMNIHVNSARNYFIELKKKARIWWLPVWNLEKFNLQNYILLLKMDSANKQSDLINLLESIPYIKTVYQSKDQNGSFVVFSNEFCCPPQLEETLNSRLKKWQDEKLITDYIFKPRQAYITHHTLSSKKIRLNLINYRKLTTKLDDYIFRYTNSHTEYIRSLNNKSKPTIQLDYNLLSFLSIYRFRDIAKANYFVYITDFYKLCEKNNINRADNNLVMDFLNQLEIRARKRNLFNYTLLISPVTGFENVLIHEIPFNSTKEMKRATDLIEKYYIFSFTTQHVLDNKIILMVRGGFTYKHLIFDIIKQAFTQNGFDTNFYSVNWHNSKPIPFQNLFDYDNNDWVDYK